MWYLVMLLLGVFNGVINSWSTLSPDELSKMSTVCEANKGVEKVRIKILGNNEVFCKDGAEFKL